MALKIVHHIVLDESPALTKLIEVLTSCNKEDEKVKQEIMDKLNSAIADIKSTIKN